MRRCIAHGSPKGALRVIDTTKPDGSCASWEASLNWNQRGAAGRQGSVGQPDRGVRRKPGADRAEGRYRRQGGDWPQGPRTTSSSATLPLNSPQTVLDYFE
jgi:hypothetical protein